MIIKDNQTDQMMVQYIFTTCLCLHKPELNTLHIKFTFQFSSCSCFIYRWLLYHCVSYRIIVAYNFPFQLFKRIKNESSNRISS